MARTTIADVAKAAGVSTFTVSQTLRGKNHVAPATREKVLKVAKELNYTASRAASSLASGKENRIALLARERIGGWFMGELTEGMYDVLSKEDYDIVIYRASSDTERSHFFERLPMRRNADALVVTGFPVTESEKNALSKIDMPIVAVNSPDTAYCQASITTDDVAAEAAAVRYLAAIGHRRFCYLGRADPLCGNSWGYDARALGYMEAIAELNLTDCGSYHIDPLQPNTVSQSVASILSNPERPTALCVWSDYYAVSVLHELRRNGLQVPEDMSVMGFDGSDMATALDLTTMAQPAREIGRLAARKALALARGETLDDSHTVIEPTLQIGLSTKPLIAMQSSE